MDNLCPECGAPIPEGGACLDHFHKAAQSAAARTAQAECVAASL